jgi:hypothetical protein
VAIVQISQITNRKGLQENLPQLAGGELGWSINTRQLWIGNGTLQEGAPIIGNTEILTEFSDILNYTNTYTYKGEAAGYTVQTGPTDGTPVSNSLQTWLDQYASVIDFGATGDGVTDDTEAINRALFQLFCRQANPQIRRSLYFPAGVYKVTGSINIPPYATLYGEGGNNSVIQMQLGVNDFVARTADSAQQTGANIGNAGATPPTDITIINMGFEHLDPVENVFLVQNATNMCFRNVGFRSTGTTTTLATDSNQSIGVSFASNVSFVCEQIVFDQCVFSGLTWGVNTDQRVKGVTISNSLFDTLYRGVQLGEGPTVNDGPTGVRIIGNVFDNISYEGIVFGQNLTLGLNASGHNIFYDVGNQFTTSQGTPVSPVISIQTNNNVSISDLFERTPAFATTYPRIDNNQTLSISTTNGESMTMGTHNQLSGTQDTLINDTTDAVFTFSTNVAKAFKIDYTIIRNVSYRTGTIMVATDSGSGDLNFNDTFVENNSAGVTLSASQVGTTVSLDYTTTDTGQNGTIYYSITYFA